MCLFCICIHAVFVLVLDGICELRKDKGYCGISAQLGYWQKYHSLSLPLERHSVFMIIFVSILCSYWFNKFGFHWSLICFSCYVSSGTQKLKAQLWRFCLQTLESRVISKYSWCIDASYCTANCDDKAVVETGWTTCRNLGNTWRDAALSTIDNPSIGILARAGFQGKQPSAKFPADFEVVDKHSQLNFQKILIVKHKNMLFSRVFSLLNIPF